MIHRPAPRTIPAPSDHGDDVARVAAALGVDPSCVLDLAQTLNPVAPDVTLFAQRHLRNLVRYPDTAVAVSALAAALGYDDDRVVLTNGGAEAIALVAAELHSGWVDEPDFSLYRRHLEIVDPNAGRWRSNPHNPTGRLAAPDERSAVWDEAFWPITTGSWTRRDADNGAIVIGSLTKLFACPGLRLGYVIAPNAAFAEAIRRRQPRWSVNGIAASLVPELIDGADLVGWSTRVRQLRKATVSALVDRGLEVESGDAPWVLVRRPGLRDDLASRGVLVRDCASFGLQNTFRIATPRPDDLPRLLEAIDQLPERDGAST
jgi:histidinol-phosphate/aromatic aminotransferase/cobyric acid decarboxylase-like protein